MGNKTEKPTSRRLREGAKKGQTLKSRDFTITCIMLVGTLYISFVLDFDRLTVILKDLVAAQFTTSTVDYFWRVCLAGLLIVIPFILSGIVTTALSTWIQTRLSLATEAVRINFDALNPINGFKKIFSLRTVKDLVKTLLYIVILSEAVWLFWEDYKGYFFVPLYQKLSEITGVWGLLLFRMITYCLCSIIVILIIDFILEYFLFMKDMKMDKEEVKRDRKEQEGAPEIKSRRRALRDEFLSEQLQSDVSNSRMIIANPTHIAIGIYFRPDVSPIPMISLRESNQKALAVRKYAEKVGIPVIQDVQLARRIYATHRRYNFVSLQEIDAVLRLLIWLEEVEMAGLPEQASFQEVGSMDTTEDGTASPEK